MLKPLLIGVGWLAAAVASLLVAGIPYDTEALCGIWGCFPPLPALAAMHLFWCIVFGASIWIICGWRPRLLQPLGVLLLLAATVTAAVVVGYDLERWFHRVTAQHHPFWWRRVAYTIATLSDVPLLQSIVAGVVCIMLGRRTGKL
jgi:hypothetical protein